MAEGLVEVLAEGLIEILAEGLVESGDAAPALVIAARSPALPTPPPPPRTGTAEEKFMTDRRGVARGTCT